MLFDLAIHLVAGVTFALAAVKLHESETAARSTGLWTLVPFLSFFVAPVMILLFYRNPEWFLLYFVEVDTFRPALAAVQLPVLGVGVGAYLLARKFLLARKHPLNRFVLLVVTSALAAALVLIGWGRMAVVGRTAEVVAETGTRPLHDTTEGYLLAGAGLVIGLGWLLTTWRLFLYARAVPLTQRYVGQVPVRDGHTQALPHREPAQDEQSAKAGKKKARA